MWTPHWPTPIRNKWFTIRKSPSWTISRSVKVVQKYLKLAGYQRFITTTDREAVALVERERPDVLLLDIMMPYVSGLEILATLRADARFADLPVIILTAATEKDTKFTALKLGRTRIPAQAGRMRGN